MIIDSKGGSIETIGDVKEFKTTIDPKNLEFITTLLSSNLYSAPEQSFIREIVSNAWDSHVEAGTTDTPVIIKFSYANKYSSSGKVTIRDYGTGLSEEKFNELYCSIGSSTKRHTNTLHGGFGIGKFSSLACSNVVYINSYYNGEVSMYVMTKNGNTITTNLVNKQPTTEKNGVEISIQVNEMHKYKDALSYIHFFPNVYVDNDPSFNNAKIKRFKNFAVCSERIHHKLLLGHVLYPLDKKILSKESRDFISKMDYYGIAICFNIGELQVTPNRENIIYTTDTINTIENRILEAKKEIEGIISKKCKTNIDSPFEWYSYVMDTQYFDFINDRIDNTYDSCAVVPFRPTEFMNSPITLGGRVIKNVSPIGSMYRAQYPNLVGVCKDGKVYRGSAKLPYAVYNIVKQSSNNPIRIVDSKFKFTTDIKAFINKNMEDTLFISDFSLNEYRNYALTVLKNTTIYYPEEVEFIIEQCYKTIKENATPIDFNSDATFLQFKQDIKTARKEVKKFENVKLNVTFIYPSTTGYRCGVKIRKEYNNYDEVVSSIKNYKKGVLFLEAKDNRYDEIAWCFDYVIVKAAKNLLQALKEDTSLKCRVTEEEFNNSNKIKKLRSMAKATQVRGKFYNNSKFVSMLPTEMRSVLTDCTKLNNLVNTDTLLKIQGDVLANKELDDSLLEILNKIGVIYDKYLEYISIVGTGNIYSKLYETILGILILKDKAFRVNYSYYKDIKNNKLFTILCKK